MHPALSVIFFTVTSGAGFGFLALIGLGVPMSESGIGAFFACLIAGVLCVAGLLSSTFHLGHPERAWRAFSQWRSSWLSREGICAVFTLMVFAIYALFWVFFGYRIGVLGLIMAIGALATVYTTSMIYAQLKTVPAWNTWLTTLCYMCFSLTCGCLLAGCWGYWDGVASVSLGLIIAILLVISWGAKLLWWSNSAKGFSTLGSDAGTATGLGKIGKVSLLEKPHSGENYLTKEMVHQIGRKHAVKLRIIAILFGFVLPLILSLLFTATQSQFFLLLAILSLFFGLLVERWLFFAEAKHAVSLYYS